MSIQPVNLLVDDALIMDELDAEAKAAFRRGRIKVILSVASGKDQATEVLWLPASQDDVDMIDAASAFFDAHGGEPSIRRKKTDENPVVPAEPTS